MQWLRVETKFPSHPKTLAAIELVGRGNRARLFGVWFEAATYAAAQDTDGFVPNAVVHSNSLDPNHQKLVTALLSAGLLEPHPSGKGYQLHDFTTYNPSKETQEEWKAKQAEYGRQGGLRSGESRRSQRPPEGSVKATLQGPFNTPSEGFEAPILSSPFPSDPIPSDPRRADLRARAWPRPLVNGPGDRVHGTHAVCFRERGLCVPYGLHDEFMARLGTGEGRQERLDGFYARTIAALPDGPIGDDVFDFWRHSFAHWAGTVTSKPSGRKTAVQTTLDTIRRLEAASGD